MASLGFVSGGYPVDLTELYADVARQERRRRRQERLIRLLDIIVSGTALCCLAPVLLVAIAGIWLSDGAPFFFCQQRIGRDGRPFTMIKLRSMYRDAEARKAALQRQNQHGSLGVTFKSKTDPRIFWWGRWIRKLSIDELPQLWNVLRGDMSLVGPRPALPKEVGLYSQLERLRLSVPPGITCFWQVQGRANLPFDQQVALDVAYIRQRSLWTNLCILVATVPAVLTGKGAY